MKRFMLATLTLVLLVTGAQAGERRYHARGTGQFTSATDFISEGIATHLGPFQEFGSVEFGNDSDPTAVPFTGWATHIAANGDELHETFTGTLNFLSGAGTATMTYVGGTGRFAEATGSSAFSLQLLDGFKFEYTGEGVIDY